MKLTFRLRYHTRFGQSLWLTGNHELFGNDEFANALPLQYLDQQTWQATVLMPRRALPDTEIVFRYWLEDTDGSATQDWGNDRVLNLATVDADELLIIDAWNEPWFIENTFYTEPFKEVLLRQANSKLRAQNSREHGVRSGRISHRFQVKTPLLEPGQTVCLLGDSDVLGHWDTSRPVLLDRIGNRDFLRAELDVPSGAFPLQYKYGVYDFEQKRFLRYEDGPNRILHDQVSPRKLTIINDGFGRLPISNWKGAGVSIPLFSLRSKRSFGVGQITDLELLADWCVNAGLKLIQLLPINDTSATHTWTDSYPYAAISAFALHPIYLDLSRVATPENQKRLAIAEPERQRLNALNAVDYEAVLRAKLPLLEELFASQKSQTFGSDRYRHFFHVNRHWLEPYAVFAALRDTFGTADFNRWPEHQSCDAEAISRLCRQNSPIHERVSFYFFLQYHLHLQLEHAVEHLHSKGIILKGDIPIGVYRFGADAWQHPELFNMDMQAGAPPDPFGAKGQNWGFPTYNWPRMEQDAFRWWKQRFEEMGRYFDAFRIDHILGFFRIWSVPLDAVEGILGRFVPALPVLPEEFSARGIPFNRDRYVQPYITDPVLQEVFGPQAEMVKSAFLDRKPEGGYGLKPQFSTQRQIEAHFAELERGRRGRAVPAPHLTATNAKLKEGLFDLASNVILLEQTASVGDEVTSRSGQGPEYHFRFGIESTLSFQALDGGTQAGLKDLYIDYFYRRQDVFWKAQALRKLPALKRATDMLVCGEDLGMVPGCVPEVMKQLGLLSLEIQRMPKDLSREFSNPKDAPYLSVVTPSTHDMSTIRGWWTENPSVTQRFYNNELGLPGLAPAECSPALVQAIVAQHLASPAMWSIFQLQDLLGMDDRLRHPDPAAERINVPANPRNYWRYRVHMNLEDLLAADKFTEQLRTSVHAHLR